MIKFTLSLLLTAFMGAAHGQTLSPSVISSSGGFFVNGPALSFTVAEMSMVQTFAAPGNAYFLTQGFQQPLNSDISTGIAEPTMDGVAFDVFPNPSGGYVHLVLNTKNNADVTVRLFDALGKTILTDQFSHSGGADSYAYNWSNVSTGMYIIEVITTDRTTNSTQKSMKKINIIN